MSDFRLATDVRPVRYQLRFDLDLDGWRSAGTARIEVATERATKEIVLHSLDLDIAAARLDGELAVDISYDERSQSAQLEFSSEVAAGSHVLELEWTGEIRADLRGLYRTVRGEERYVEAAGAHGAFPCFDEPEFKARFTFELVHPTGPMAVANMPIASQTDLGNGRTRTTFEETPIISSHLVTFTVGPYEATPVATTKTGIPTRAILPPGLAVRGEYARDAHVRALEWLEAYTGIPYPYRKLDLIGLPGKWSGAMQYPGAITAPLRRFAADDESASIPVFKTVFGVGAHELAHMWWSNLVTVKWWTHSWLDESFAQFAGGKCTDALNPEWQMRRDFVAEAAPAFYLDSLASTHPISVDAVDAHAVIKYYKGTAVLRMIENVLGENAFRDALRLYLERHREANATTDDFLRALDESSGRAVTALANAWIHEPGHPLVRCSVREEDVALAVTLRQERFLADPDVKDTGQTWPIPLVIAYGTDAGRREERVLLEGRETTVRLPGARWYFPNAGAVGFYRYSFDDRSVALLTPALASLRPEERLSMLDDQWALARARKAGIAQFIALVAALRSDTERAVMENLDPFERRSALAWLDAHAVADGARPAFQRFVSAIFGPELAALGWDRRPDDSPDERERRRIAIAALALRAGDADVHREARQRLEAHLDGTARLDPDIADAVVDAAASEGDGALYERYIARMKEAEKTDAQEEARFRNGLTQFRDPAVVRRLCDDLFTDLIRVPDRGRLLTTLLTERHSRVDAWRVTQAHWDAHIATRNKHQVIGAVGWLIVRPLAAEAAAFLEAKRTSDSEQTTARALEHLRISTATAERIAAELPDALDRVSERVRA